MTTKDPAYVLASMWLAGYTYEDILRSSFYKTLHDDVRLHVAGVWMSLERAAGYMLAFTITGPEQSVYERRRPAQRKRQC
jgi:hypothetical protein